MEIDINMSDDAIGKTTNCRFKFACLHKDTKHPLCKEDYSFAENHMFVKKYEADFDCPYHINFFADTYICTCPMNCSRSRQKDRSG